MKISKKITINSLVVLVLLLLNAFGASVLIQRIIGDVHQMAGTEIPLVEAVLEMEIKAGETAWAVLHFVQTREEENLGRIRDSEADFERYTKDFERLAGSEEIQVLGVEVTVLFSEFLELGDEIISLSRLRYADLVLFRKDVEEIEEVIDENLQAVIDRAAPGGMVKLESALEMEINIDKAFAGVEAYILQRHPTLLQNVRDAEADFARHLARYRMASLSAEEEDLLEIVEKDFNELVIVGKGIVKLKDQSHLKLAKFEGDLREIERILDEEVKVIIHGKTLRAEENAKRSGKITTAFILVASLLMFALVANVARIVSRGITDTVDPRSVGASEFSKGNLENRIEGRVEDEPGATPAFKEMADRHKQAEHFFLTLIEALPTALVLVDGSGHIAMVNRAAELAFGYDRHELVGQLVEMLLPKKFKKKHPSQRAGYCEDPQIRPMGVGPDLYALGKNGHEFPVEVMLCPVNFEGQPMVLGSLSDISDRKQAEDALRQSEENLHITLNSIGDAVIATDLRGKVTRLNPIAESLTGWTLEEAKGKPLSEIFNIVSSMTNEPAADPIKLVMESRATVKMASNTILIAKGGTRHQIADSAAPVTSSDGTIKGMVLVFRDMTEEYQRQAHLRQQQKLESIGTLAGGVAHEINNPIMGIMLNAQIIDDRLDPESPLRDLARGIGAETHRIAEIVKNLLTFSRQERESHSQASITDILNITVALFRTIIRRDQINLVLEVPDDLPKIKCRSQQIQQVIMNLLTNARDALNERYPEHDENKIIRLTIRTIDKKGQPGIRVTVQDHGTGIPDSIRDHLFDPFFTTKDRTRGTGLGLSISHGIVLDHQGDLTFESKPGEYSRFHIDLPLNNGWELGETPGNQLTEKETD